MFARRRGKLVSYKNDAIWFSPVGCWRPKSARILNYLDEMWLIIWQTGSACLHSSRLFKVYVVCFSSTFRFSDGVDFYTDALITISTASAQRLRISGSPHKVLFSFLTIITSGVYMTQCIPVAKWLQNDAHVLAASLVQVRPRTWAVL